jgi:PilZ domain
MKRSQAEKAVKKTQATEIVTRRTTERLVIALPVAVRSGGHAKGPQEHTETLDFSRGGTCFLGRKKYRAGMTLHLGFLDLQNLPSGMKEISARVVRVRPPDAEGASAVAVVFRDASAANLLFGELLRAKIRTSNALLGIIQAFSPGMELEGVIQYICRLGRRNSNRVRERIVG